MRCNGSTFERCFAGEFVPLNRCATRALCTPDMGCLAPICDLTDYTCSADGRTLTTCIPGRDGVRVTTCPLDTTCDPQIGRCVQMP
jgi:hypothetical protein